MKLVMVASEANPYVKTGGLADVVYALSRQMAVTGEEVAVILPLYNQARKKLTNCNKVGEIVVNMSWRRETSNVYHERNSDIDFYFIENHHYFERENIYGYGDDGERFAFFSLASLETLKSIDFKPDIIHVHDWQSGMVPCLIKEKHDSFFAKTKTVLTIHNPAFQGMIFRESLGDLYGLPLYLYDNGALRFKDNVSTLKGGIMYADKITTVSPTHREELLTEEGSMGLNYVLRFREFDFCGFLNGIDYEEFNPETDKLISANFNEKNYVSNKKANKKFLCEKFGFKNQNAPIFALVSRITWQKGMSLVFAATNELIARGANILLLGSGEYEYERQMQKLNDDHPGQVGVYIGYNNELAHQIYAGSDFFMMPSLFEPCGLGQMIAQRYGTLPIVRRVGGLKDSVINYDGHNIETANGFGFDYFSDYEMTRTCIYAFDQYQNKEVLKRLVKNAIKTDNSWEKSGEQYHGLYRSLLK